MLYPTLLSVVAKATCLENLLSHLTIRDTLALRALSSHFTDIVDTSLPVQEKLFFSALLPIIPPPLPTFLELNPLLFARPYRWFKRNGFDFCQLPAGYYQFHIETALNQEWLLEQSGWQGLQAVLTKPSQTLLTVDMRGHGSVPVQVANPPPPPITWIARITVSNNSGITYGDLLREAVRECKRQGASVSDSMTMEARFPYGQKLRLGPYTEVLGRLSDAHRARIGV